MILFYWKIFYVYKFNETSTEGSGNFSVRYRYLKLRHHCRWLLLVIDEVHADGN